MGLVFGAPVIRRYDLLWRLVESVKRSSVQPDLLVIVDNGKQLASHFVALPSWSLVVTPPEGQYGCAGAWNKILDAAGPGDLAIVSNDDIELVPDSIQTIASALGDFELVAGHGFALFGMRKSLTERIGFFDENLFPAYFEDNDYSRRCKLAGIPIGVVDAKAEHGGSASLHCLPLSVQHEFGRTFEQIRSYYVRKWGNPPHKGERFRRPFNGKSPEGWRERCITR